MKRIQIIDSHTGGEPTRLVIGGFPELGKGSMMERRALLAEQHDAWRAATVLEPRGNDVIVGALLCAPQDPANTAGVIFFNNTGYLGMCGHGTIGLVASLAYLTLAERKVIGYMQIRIGPNRVGPKGLLQPIADGIKLMLKEIVLPAKANKTLFLVGPILSIAPALAAWAVVPFMPKLVLANIDASLLYIMAVTSIGVYGVIVAGWASNSKYAFLGAMRSAAQIVSYEIAMGFALVGVLIAAGSLNLGDIVNAQRGALGPGSWFFVPLFPLFVIYFISGVAETNRAPFDFPEAELLKKS